MARNENAYVASAGDAVGSSASSLAAIAALRPLEAICSRLGAIFAAAILARFAILPAVVAMKCAPRPKLAYTFKRLIPHKLV